METGINTGVELLDSIYSNIYTYYKKNNKTKEILNLIDQLQNKLEKINNNDKL
jgi:hypothetical protein